jgi:chloramphenicol 3-O phosphotransferase
MAGMDGVGTIVVLNGPPRAGKSAIAAAVQDRLDGLWLNLGVDTWALATPAHLRPGIGLRPGGERPEVEAAVPLLFAGLYEAVAAQSRLGLNVVVDVGHHEAYAGLRNTLRDAARRLEGLPAWLVGVRCPLDEVMRRRHASEPGTYVQSEREGDVPTPVRRWQEAVHQPGVYDLEVDTSRRRPDDCADAIGAMIAGGRATAFSQLA